MVWPVPINADFVVEVVDFLYPRQFDARVLRQEGMQSSGPALLGPHNEKIDQAIPCRHACIATAEPRGVTTSFGLALVVFHKKPAKRLRLLMPGVEILHARRD